MDLSVHLRGWCGPRWKWVWHPCSKAYILSSIEDGQLMKFDRCIHLFNIEHYCQPRKLLQAPSQLIPNQGNHCWQYYFWIYYFYSHYFQPMRRAKFRKIKQFSQSQKPQVFLFSEFTFRVQRPFGFFLYTASEWGSIEKKRAHLPINILSFVPGCS